MGGTICLKVSERVREICVDLAILLSQSQTCALDNIS